jgi:hypothetical protein
MLTNSANNNTKDGSRSSKKGKEKRAETALFSISSIDATLNDYFLTAFFQFSCYRLLTACFLAYMTVFL